MTGKYTMFASNDLGPNSQESSYRSYQEALTLYKSLLNWLDNNSNLSDSNFEEYFDRTLSLTVTPLEKMLDLLKKISDRESPYQEEDCIIHDVRVLKILSTIKEINHNLMVEDEKEAQFKV